MHAMAPEDRPTLSIVVPCYNEEANLPELYQRVTDVSRRSVGQAYELVLVDDGSRDGTWPSICKLVKQDPNVVGVSLSRNFGHQLALSTGLQICRGQRVLVLDADL